jgi:hypothetical protein
MERKAIRAVHIRVDTKDVTDKLVQFIKEGLAPLGFNMLCIEFNPGYDYKCYPDMANGTFGKADAQKVAAAAKEAGIRIVPLFMCLGHQGWRFERNSLLKAHPELDEQPYMPEGEEGSEKTPDLAFYCRSWCASNDEVYKYVFPMMDEIMQDFGADCLHVGMDEVFSLAESTCPNCAGKKRPDLFARTVNILYDHIVKEKGWEMMMWADRLNHAEAFGYHAWEADIWDTWKAIDMIPKDIILADWHYDMNEQGFAGIGALVEKGFAVIPAGWRSLKQARFLWEEAVKHSKAAMDKGASGYLAGMMITNWREMSNELFDEYLQLLKDKVQDEGNEKNKEKRMSMSGVASSAVFVAQALKDFVP